MTGNSAGYRVGGLTMSAALFLFVVAGSAFAADGVPVEFHPCHVKGMTAPGAWVVANSGEITQADESGHYEIVFPVQGVYCLKAMKDGFDEAVRPWLVVPAPCNVNLPLWARPNPARRVVHGNLGHPAQLEITDSGRPVLGFDFAGTAVGSYPAPKGVWHHKNQFFWTAGEYAFTATGEVKIVESLDFRELRARGWYKGDFHAHVVHGENFYRANLQQMNFVCRAERYDWIWLSQAHANDEYPLDPVMLAEFLSDGKLFLRVNNEFPKNIYGHYGDIGVEPLSPKDYGPGYAEQKVTNLELAEKTIYARGGLAVPVHPIYGDVVRTDKRTGRKTYGMINNELMLWLLCRPDMVPVVDFFYFPEERAEKFWYRLLNKGYTLACSGTSDAAFDVGRSPGSSHATYAKLDKIDNASIVKAFREGRTMVSYYGAGVIIEIDGKTSGDKLLPGSQERTLTVDAYADPGKNFTLRVIRNGEVFEERNFTAPADGHFSFTRRIVEKGNAWYVAMLKNAGSRSPRAAASPIYFRGPDFKPPEVVPLPLPLPQNIKERLLYLTPQEVDTDEWYEELKRLLKEASAKSL